LRVAYGLNPVFSKAVRRLGMNNLSAALALILLSTSPAHATGGFLCRTAGKSALEVSVGFGHVAGSPLILTRLTDNGRTVPSTAAQWWLDQEEMRLLLTDPAAQRQQLLLKAKRNGFTYDGSLWRNGQRRWVRCRES
jgi:hypothetical protein